MGFRVPTNTSWVALLFILSELLLFVDNSLGESTEEFGTVFLEGGETYHPAHAVLFPSFVLTLGVLVYYVLSRYLRFLPYTAVSTKNA